MGWSPRMGNQQETGKDKKGYKELGCWSWDHGERVLCPGTQENGVILLTINLSDFQIPHRSNEGEGLDDLSKSSYNPMM